MIYCDRAKATLFTIFFILIFASVSFAQESPAVKGNNDKKKKDILTIKNKSSRFFSEKKKRVKGVVKADSPNKYAEYQRKLRTRDGETEPSYSPDYLIKELNQAKRNLSLNKANQTLNWVERGPGNVSGRTRGLIVDASDASGKTWFAGSVGGGIWKTVDMGYNWINVTPEMPNIATTVLIQCPSNPDIIYCGTGEGFYNLDAIAGSGIFKSTDHGNSWKLLQSTANFNFYSIDRMVVDPSNADIVLACTYPGPNAPSGIYRSTDGGINWTKVFTSNSYVQDLRSDPVNFQNLYAAVNRDGVYKSTNGGINWVKSSTGILTSGRIEIAIAPTKPNFIYAAAEVSTGSALYISTDGAQSWTKAVASDNKNYDWLGGQGWYDNTIAVSPYSETTVFVGGIDLMKAELKPTQTISIDEINTKSFLDFVKGGLPYKNGGIGRGTDLFKMPAFDTAAFNLTEKEYVSIELRFGPGKSQKAHRFVLGTDSIYHYKDYVDVPFEAWDINNNKQLAISFRDWKDNGTFEIIKYVSSNIPREYLLINAVAYNAAGPEANIAKDNGIIYKNIYAIWPNLPFGATWNPATIPASTLRLNAGIITYNQAIFTPVTDAYNQYTKPYIHPDQHNILFIPKDAATGKFWILNGNDGGVALSTDMGATWREALSGGYNTTQFYGVDKKPGADQYFGGTQDNGTWLSPAGISPNAKTAYIHALGGDGFDVAWNYKDGNQIIGSLYYNRLYKTSDGGSSWHSSVTNLKDIEESFAPFLTKIGKSNTDPDVIFIGGKSGIWRSENFGDTWDSCVVSTKDYVYNGSAISIAPSIADPQIVWAGAFFSNNTSNIYLSKDGGLVFKSIKPYGGVALGNNAGIYTHPTDPNSAFMTFAVSGAPKIIRTTDLGNSWEDITGFGTNSVSSNGFPNVATYCVAVMPYNTNIIWAGTEIGLFESTDKGISWHYANNGLPAVCIWDMKIVDDQVVLATHGRGIFSVTLDELKGYTPPVVALAPIILSSSQGPDGALIVQTNLRSAYDSVSVMINGTVALTQKNPASGNQTLKFPVTTSGFVNIQVIAFNGTKVLKSSQKNVQILVLQQARTSYANNFNSPTVDFAGNGFTVIQPTGFSSPGVNSPHKYAEKSSYLYYLLSPIKINASEAFVEYDDIAIVEPGDPGTQFGDAEFWDYVVVEGSKDGINWVPLENGYDCNYNTKWKDLWTSGKNPDSTFYVHHKVNMLNKFAANDVILLRFRLFSDEASVGWGWIFDNLSIQGGIVGVTDENSTPQKFSLTQNYPNPFNPSTVITYGIMNTGRVTLKVFDLLGREVVTLVDEVKQAGKYQTKFEAKNLPSGIYYYKLEAGSFSETKKMSLIK